MTTEQFRDFTKALVERSARADWPIGASEFWRDFRRELDEIGATPEEADVASRRACSRPDMFVNSFRPFIVAEVPRIRAERSPGAALPTPRIVAREALPPPDAPEWQIQTPADLQRFCASLAASKSARGGFIPPPPREARHGDARAVPARVDLADAVSDPIVASELARRARRQPAPPATLTIPEDAALSGWY